MEVVVSLVIVMGATAAIFNLSKIAERSPYLVSRLEYINNQSKYQVLLFCVAMFVLLVLLFYNGANLSSFFTPGNIAAPAVGVSWLGITEGESWSNIGASLSFFITLATSAFVFLQFRKSVSALKQLIPFLPWILLFSLSNSFSEEVVYRLGIIVPLFGTIDTDYILIFSAAAFGAPHLRGMPNGIVGALMAGLLGWLLAKSMIETNGMFWAWFIHFLQDVVIFSVFVISAAKSDVDTVT